MSVYCSDDVEISILMLKLRKKFVAPMSTGPYNRDDIDYLGHAPRNGQDTPPERSGHALKKQRGYSH